MHEAARCRGSPWTRSARGTRPARRVTDGRDNTLPPVWRRRRVLLARPEPEYSIRIGPAIPGPRNRTKEERHDW
jgi:hypothetical protein